MVAIKKSWQEIDYSERVETIANTQIEISKKIKQEEKEQRETRKQILGLAENEPTRIKRYSFIFPNDLILSENDEEKVKKVLENIAQNRYATKPGKYQIYDDPTESKEFLCIWDALELRWPSHYAGYIESIYLLRNDTLLKTPAKVDITFVRGGKILLDYLKKDPLKREAQKIYEQIKSQLKNV